MPPSQHPALSGLALRGSAGFRVAKRVGGDRHRVTLRRGLSTLLPQCEPEPACRPQSAFPLQRTEESAHRAELAAAPPACGSHCNVLNTARDTSSVAGVARAAMGRAFTAAFVLAILLLGTTPPAQATPGTPQLQCSCSSPGRSRPPEHAANTFLDSGPSAPSRACRQQRADGADARRGHVCGSHTGEHNCI